MKHMPENTVTVAREDNGQWGYTYYAEGYDCCGTHTNWCNTKEEAEKWIQRLVDKGYTLVDGYFDPVHGLIMNDGSTVEVEEKQENPVLSQYETENTETLKMYESAAEKHADDWFLIEPLKSGIFYMKDQKNHKYNWREIFAHYWQEFEKRGVARMNERNGVPYGYPAYRHLNQNRSAVIEFYANKETFHPEDAYWLHQRCVMASAATVRDLATLFSMEREQAYRREHKYGYGESFFEIGMFEKIPAGLGTFKSRRTEKGDAFVRAYREACNAK